MLVDFGGVSLDGKPVEAHELGFLEPGAESVELATSEKTRLLLLGGPPFGEQIVMWWNYIGREHEEVLAYRAEWEQLLETGTSDRFRLPENDPREALHSPPLPNVRMVKRGP